MHLLQKVGFLGATGNRFKGPCTQVGFDKVTTRASVRIICKVLIRALGFKGPCSQIVYTLALRYFGARKVYTMWVHGPSRIVCQSQGGGAGYPGTLIVIAQLPVHTPRCCQRCQTAEESHALPMRYHAVPGFVNDLTDQCCGSRIRGKGKQAKRNWEQIRHPLNPEPNFVAHRLPHATQRSQVLATGVPCKARDLLLMLGATLSFLWFVFGIL